jgi:tRNA pseudouridine55 synthase
MLAQTRPEKRPLTGIVLVDKPSGLTSNRVLQRVKRLFRAQKAGHTGTLDPMATGMLPICFGAATKVSGLMLGSSKRYRVTAKLGVATDTGDATGEVTGRHEGPPVTAEALETAAAGFVGPSLQVPPMYSAVKHEGRRLYELARQGKEVEREPREIKIYALDIERYAWPEVTFSVHCSKGTYVRTLVTDLATKLGTLAHVTALRRLAVDPFAESQMVSLESLEQAAEEGLDSLDRWLLGADAALVDMPAVEVTEAECEALRHGQAIPAAAGTPEGPFRIYDADGRFVGLGGRSASGMLKPTRIFPS